MFKKVEGRISLSLAFAALVTSVLLADVPEDRRKATGEAQLVFDYVSHRLLDSLDKGRTQVFLRNISTSPVLVTEILLNGRSVPTCYVCPSLDRSTTTTAYTEDQYILWARVLPNPVPPGGVSEILIVWAEDAKKPVDVVIRTNARSELRTIIPIKVEPPLRMMAIRFAPDLRRVFLYAKNLGKNSFSLQRVFLDGLDVTSQTFIGTGVLLQESNGTTSGRSEIKPGEIKCLEVVRRHQMSRGELVFAKIVADDAADEGWARVYPEFPFGPEFTEERYCLEYGRDLSEFAGIRQEMPKFVRVEHCLTHRPEKLSWSQRARVVLAAERDCRGRFPQTLTIIHLCKTLLEKGTLSFAPICDSIMTNTNESEMRSANEAKNELETSTQRLSRFVSSACAPRPWFQIVMLRQDERFPEFRERLPDGPETRARVYWALSGGCHGLCYRGFSQKLPADLRHALGTIEAELSQIGSHLIYSYPVLQGWCSDPRVEVCGLQAGYDALLLIVINHDFHHLLTPDLERAAAWRAKRDLEIHLTVPAGLHATKAFWVFGQGQTTLRCTARGRELSISLPQLLQAEIVVLPAANAVPNGLEIPLPPQSGKPSVAR